MLDCLVIVEQNGEELTEASLRLCSRLQHFGGWASVRLSALLKGTCSTENLKTFGELGVERVFQLQAFDSCEPESWRTAILNLVREYSMTLVILPGTSLGRELAPGVAALWDAGALADCQELRWLDGSLKAVVETYGAQYQLELELTGERHVVVMADIDPGDVKPKILKECSVINIPALRERGSALKVLETYYLPASELDIEEADVVVGIGRGVESKQDLEIVRELAEALGATIAGSRPAVDAGFIPFSSQIGQTGKLITPQIYLAIGISGAPQHITGVGQAKIVAINHDPLAPILRLAELGVTGDLREVVPLLTRRLKEIKEGRR